MLSRCADQHVLSSFATCTKAMSRTASQEGVRVPGENRLTARRSEEGAQQTQPSH
jgi:hypothetical protein